MEQYVMDCGCRFNIVEKRDKGLPRIEIPLDTIWEDLRVDCPRTIALLGSGQTKGVFQLESQLGRSWSKKLKPEGLEHMAALVALLRPGCLEAKDDNGISMTEHYCRRKNKQEEVEVFHPAIEPILAPTYQVLAYQEQAMLIAANVAGFSKQQADNLRKAMGKKLPEEMAKVKTMFVEGAAAAGILTVDEAAEIFGWIEKSQRYSFNKSHASCYGQIGLVTAQLKAHFTIEFFTSWLYYGMEKGDAFAEIRDLIEDAKAFDISVLPPDITLMEQNFFTDQDAKIWFGLADIKGIGNAQITRLLSSVAEAEGKLNKRFPEMTWFEMVTHVFPKLNTSAVERFIRCGALSGVVKMSRKRMLAEWDAFNRLTEKEQTWIIDKAHEFGELSPALERVGNTKKNGGGAANVKRVEVIKSTKLLLDNPPSPLVDDSQWVVWHESELLGTALTANILDDKETEWAANTTCRELRSGKKGPIAIACEIKNLRAVKIKNGKNIGRQMAFMTIGDATGSMDDVVMWSESYEHYKDMLAEGNTVIAYGETDKKNGSFIIKKVIQI